MLYDVIKTVFSEIIIVRKKNLGKEIPSEKLVTKMLFLVHF